MSQINTARAAPYYEFPSLCLAHLHYNICYLHVNFQLKPIHPGAAEVFLIYIEKFKKTQQNKHFCLAADAMLSNTSIKATVSMKNKA